MADAHALSSAPPQAAASDWLEQVGHWSVIGVAIALQFSIAVAQSLLAIAILCWLVLVVSRRERVEVPRFFWLLVAYGALTLVSAAFSPEPATSFIDCKQLVLFLLVPLTYRFLSGERGRSVISFAVSAGAASAAIGIFQYAVLHYDLQFRPRGSLGHYMTFSGLLMLVIGCALARIVFGKRDRLWALLVLPALAFAVALTFTRSAAVGACAAAALLLTLKDFRLLAILPVVAALLFAAAPAQVAKRFSTFSLKDLSVTDRGAMLREGEHMIRSHPFVGVGPNMVEELYAQYRDPRAVNEVNPHLHNVPMQIAAERGLPALCVWTSFIVLLLWDLARRFARKQTRVLTATALAAVVAMLAAGMFEYNFGDSEFLMFFLILITLPFAADRPAPGESPA
jgi:O-antigen ligase